MATVRNGEKEMKTAVLTMGGLGNVALAYPFIHQLCRTSDDVTVFVMNAGVGAEQLLTMLPVKVSVMPKSKFEFMCEASKWRHEFDVTITPFPGRHWSYRIWELMLDAQRRIGFTFDTMSRHVLTYPLPARRGISDKEQNMRLLEPFGAWAESLMSEMNNKFRHRVWLAENDIEADYVMSQFRHAGKLVAIHPCSGPAHMQRKKWPHFKRLIQRVTQEVTGARILLIGAGSEYELLPYFHVAPDNTYMLWGYDIKTVAACLARCDVLICNESGIAHIADLVGCPQAVIVGQTDVDRLRPFHGGVVHLGLSCQPCFEYPWGRVGMRKDCDDRCVKDVTVQDVWNEAVKYW